ncbi:MAG: S8 family serine peptidase [Bacteroidia bacterium]
MKTFYSIAVLAAIFLFLPLFSMSQGSQGDYRLKLQSGDFKTEPNLHLQDRKELHHESVNEIYFRIIQFYSIPNKKQKDELIALGVELMDYLPDFAFIAAIPVEADITSFGQYDVRSIIPISPEMKINKYLLKDGVPEWALRGSSKAEFEVKVHSNIDLAYAASQLRTKGYEVVNARSFGNLITVIVDKDEIENLAALPFIYFVDAISAPPVPDDIRARSLHRVNTIQNEYLGGRNYTGAGVTVAIADDGPIGPHIDFTGRVTDFTTGGTGTHGDMTAGIMVGAGNLNPDFKGSALGAHINMYNISGYDHIVSAVTHYDSLSTVITSTSYSQGSGGEYTSDAQAIDDQIRTNPQLMHVFSAGNAGSGWSTITGGYKAAKSVIACGNLNGFDVLENSSSRGPAQDGRIKPDICANGASQMSTDPNNSYAPGGGTSAASPSVAAVVTCLYEAYKTLNTVANPPSALIKAVMLNSAEDLGNSGPDFQHGWGRVNAFRALTTLEETRYLIDNVNQGDSNIHVINVPAGTSQLRVMVYWPDYAGSPVASKALVNDININLTTPGGTVYDPWVLNASSPSSIAIRGVDDLNPVEQVTLDNPAAGNYTVNVKGFVIPQGPQTYYLVYEFRTDSIIVTYPAGGEGFVPGQTEHMRWEAFGNSGTFQVEYTADNGVTWNTINNSVTSSQKQLSFIVPGSVTDEARVRVTRNGIIGMSQETFTIAGVPQNISFLSVCPDSVEIDWTGVNGAMGYEISRLGTMYMDSIAYTTATTAKVAGGGDFLTESWYSVRAIMPNGNKGRRANAVLKSAGLQNCVFAYDAELVLISPAGGTVFDCQNLNSQAISINLQNKGSNPISNIPVVYTVNGSAPVSETYTGTLAPGSSAVFTLTNTLDLTNPGIIELSIWSEYPGDNYVFNDSAQATITIVNGILVNLPWSENFESFGLCSTAGDCEAITCNLANGFLNQPNLEIDDMDWRVNNGTTPSAGTGPSFDHTTGTTTGKYVYLEATTCFQKQSHLITPCIDLTTATSPLLYFWYHMNGPTMGSLSVDVFHNGIWVMNVMPTISGSQGNSWQQTSVNLSNFAGNVITIRFRGITGTGYQSDMAIDDIEIMELASAPVALFSSNNTNACSGQIINFSDLSLNAPTQWLWTITPSTFSFVNGTSDTSQHPQIVFNAIGFYNVSLTATNSFGSNSSTQASYINVNAGAILPIVEDFQAATYPPANWSVINPDGGMTWQQSNTITGADGNPTLSSYFNNYSYNSPGALDDLISPLITVPTGVNAFLTFDVAYAAYSSTLSDSLLLEISTDCGESYVQSIYFKGGSSLATVPNQTAAFSPDNANQWRKDTLLLNSFSGNDIMLKFVNINGYGNNLYIDNINIDFFSSTEELLSSNADLNIYPNPTKGGFNINLINLKGDIKLEIIDSKGSILYKEAFTNSSSKHIQYLDINTTPGIYIIRVSSESGIINKKLISY